MRQPTEMPEWLQKQFDNAEKTVQTWSEGKREAAGIPLGDSNRVAEPNQNRSKSISEPKH